ncbi:hypothetical protein ACB288_22030 [Aeromonas taiwanensis]|uniref:hypothetical protein n=1 Tax=Aeromonas dhakensis TaxID=196024 RepID=UPI002378FA26|nr:hypothetical protein [Aeromonas dhakensis]MDD9212811.1 hypothetical protein [Aeromonas dhakensis]
MFTLFEGKDEAIIMVSGIIISVLLLLAFSLFSASFDSYKKYLNIKGKFHSKAVQAVVNHVYPHHNQLKRESQRYLFWGLISSLIAVAIYISIK